MAEVKISLDGRPPKKSEAYSLLNEKHPMAHQVLALLEAVFAEVGPDFAPYTAPVGMEVILWAPDDRDLGDATNYLGGIGDVLQTKNPKRNPMTHLGALTSVALFARSARSTIDTSSIQARGTTSAFTSSRERPSSW